MLPAGPSSPPAIQTMRWVLRPFAFLDECRRRYGDAFSVEFAGFERPMVMVSHPEAIKALYAEPANGLPPGRNALLEPILGSRSVLLLEGREHLARRRLMLPPFHGERMRAYESTVEEVVGAEIDSWPLGEPFAIHARMQAVTLEVILRAVFGVTAGARHLHLRELLSRVLAETGTVSAQVAAIVANRFGSERPWRRFEASLREIDALLFAEIAERRREGDFEDREDILSLLMLARFEDGGEMSDAELRDQLMTLLLAGHETTATALAWAFDLLLRHRAALAELRGSLATGDEEYLRAAIAESLRLRPALPLAGRRLAVPLRAAGLDLPAGTDVTPAIWLAHTRPDLYPEPFAFRPERFLAEPPETYGWIPFGGGVRRCLGAAFAEFEMRVVLREVLGRCLLHKADPAPERIGRRNITLSPKAGTPVVVTERRAARAPVPA